MVSRMEGRGLCFCVWWPAGGVGGRPCAEVGTFGNWRQAAAKGGLCLRFSFFAFFVLGTRSLITPYTQTRPAELKASYGWFREGALEQRKVEAHGAATPLWATSPAPLVAGGKARVLYNTKAGPLAWLDPAQGHAAPALTYGFNNWKLPGGAPVTMTPSMDTEVGRRRAAGGAGPWARPWGWGCNGLEGSPRQPFNPAADLACV